MFYQYLCTILNNILYASTINMNYSETKQILKIQRFDKGDK